MSKKYVKKAVYAEKGNAIVGRSDHGKVYVFEIQNPKAQQTLVHGRKDIMIQTVEVRILTHLNTLLIMFSSGNNISKSLHYWQCCC